MVIYTVKIEYKNEKGDLVMENNAEMNMVSSVIFLSEYNYLKD